MTVRILLVDDHDLVRRGVRVVLEGENDLSVVAEAASVEEARDPLRARGSPYRS